MDSSNLTPEQCRALVAKFGAMQGELGRVLKRMEERDFPPKDELQALTREAFNKLKQLTMHTHYLGCNGVGTRPPASDAEAE
jgi:hypothetical protein